uniref:DDHD domain-containing protein n=1 Tax=Panagrolaimus sp. ES5 TaxID=591445 RepID=A0AC34FBG2_9BILA
METSDVENLWVPLGDDDSAKIETILENYDNDDDFREKLNEDTIVLSGMYRIQLVTSSMGYLVPVYWQKEKEMWIIIRGKYVYEVSQTPPMLYFQEIATNPLMKSYFQPYTDSKEPEFVKEQENFNTAKRRYIPHLIFAVHGIGHVAGEEEIVQYAKNIMDGFVNFGKKFYSHFDIPVVIPIAWRYNLTLNDEVIRATSLVKIEMIKNFDFLMNDILYYVQGYDKDIINQFIKEVNTKYVLFKKLNPDFNGTISILAHSLGTVITFDALNDHYDDLKFKVENIFFIGSPLGRFLASDAECMIDSGAIKNETQGKTKANFRRRLCNKEMGKTLKQFPWIGNGKLFNIINSRDPVSRRMDVLINSEYKFVNPLPLIFKKEVSKSFGVTAVITKEEKKELDLYFERFLRDRRLVAAHDSFLKYDYFPSEKVLSNKTLWANFNSKYLGRKPVKDLNFLNRYRLIFQKMMEIVDIPKDEKLEHRLDYDLFKAEKVKWIEDIAMAHFIYWNSPEVIALITHVLYNYTGPFQTRISTSFWNRGIDAFTNFYNVLRRLGYLYKIAEWLVILIPFIVFFILLPLCYCYNVMKFLVDSAATINETFYRRSFDQSMKHYLRWLRPFLYFAMIVCFALTQICIEENEENCYTEGTRFHLYWIFYSGMFLFICVFSKSDVLITSVSQEVDNRRYGKPAFFAVRIHHCLLLYFHGIVRSIVNIILFFILWGTLIALPFQPALFSSTFESFDAPPAAMAFLALATIIPATFILIISEHWNRASIRLWIKIVILTFFVLCMIHEKYLDYIANAFEKAEHGCTNSVVKGYCREYEMAKKDTIVHDLQLRSFATNKDYRVLRNLWF